MSYFQNLANNDCTSSEIVQWFLNGTTESTFLKPDCKGIWLVLGSFFQPFGTNSGALSGFDSSGNPTYYDFSNLAPSWIANLNNQLFASSSTLSPTNISNITNNFFGGSSTTTFTGALNQYLTTNNITGGSSQWKDITGGIIFTGGMAQVGSAAAASTKIGYTWGPTIFGSTIDPSAGYTYIGWNSGLGQTHIGNGAGSYGDLFARNIQAYGNLSVSGTTNLGGNLTINTGSQICLAGSCISNFASIGGSSQWSNGAGPSIYYTGGYVGIGTSTPGYKLDVVGSVRVSSAVDVTGNVTANGFLYSSDRNLKKNITPLEGSLEKIMKLSGYSYNWKSTGKADMGVIAQEVETIYPDLVHTNAEGVKSVEYANLIAPLIEAVKTQQKEIDALKAEVASLKK